MKEWPLLLIAPMVRARREGRKTQTRRLSLSWMRAQPGDRLWVRETWAQADGRFSGVPLVYRADGDDQPCLDGRWRPSLFMPRWASRDLPTVVAVRLERLHDISEDDALAEGVKLDSAVLEPRTYRWAYQRLWDQINGKKAPWKTNPLVVVITMTKEGTK